MLLYSFLTKGIFVLGINDKPESVPDPNTNLTDLRKTYKRYFKAIKKFDKFHMLRGFSLFFGLENI